MRLVLLAPLTAAALFAQCEPSLPVREILERVWTAGYEMPYFAGTAYRHQQYKAALERHPHDYHLLRILLMSTPDLTGDLELAKSLRAQNPDQPVYRLIHAQALQGRDTPQAIQILEAIAAEHPSLSRAHLLLADIYRYGKLKNDERARRAITAFIAACPAPLDAAPLRTIGSLASPDQAAAVAAATRKRIVEQPVSLMAGVYEALWPLEFKGVPPPEHAAIRTRIAADLARLEKAPERETLRWLNLLKGGYESAGQPDAAKRTLDELLAKHPQSDVVRSDVMDRWRKQNPFPTAEPGKVEAWRRAAVKQYAEWHSRWPDDSSLYHGWFSTYAELPDASPRQVAVMGDKLIELYRANPSWYGYLPVEWIVAEAFVKKQVHLEKVVALLDEGAARQAKRDQEDLESDRMPDDFRKSVSESIESRRLDRARILLAYYAATRQTEPAKAIEAELASFTPTTPRVKAALVERQAQAAEVLGRKLDALVLYRAALNLRGSAPPAGVGDPLKDNLERLWKELGGSPAAYAHLLDRPKPEAAADSRWEKPKKPIPAFSLPDLSGKTWTLASLEGKAVMINLWATWCGPCRAEHPSFQKLYDELKSRSDVSVITFNIDDDLSKVEPYLKENKYTFPVLFAKPIVDQVLDGITIPQNWFLTRAGKLEAIQVGFGNETGWREQMMGKLEEIGKVK
ncbi:MAG: redoxin domain-containing protein [Bryobacteraceae bacterium]|nr:redoxin domain-containing protein [Bryobacteraceae bacterium]